MIFCSHEVLLFFGRAPLFALTFALVTALPVVSNKWKLDLSLESYRDPFITGNRKYLFGNRERREIYRALSNMHGSHAK